MRLLKYGSVSLLFLMIAASGFAQSTPAAEDQTAPSEAPDSAPRVHRRHSGPPCWIQAGITPDMVNQRWKIEDNQRARIAAVCSETATSPQQKHDKIDQIHAGTKQEIAQLIPAEKLATFNKCQADLDKTHPALAPKKELGPCGGVIPTPMGPEESHGMEHQHGGAPMKQ
jgi:hypothetical protein